MNIKEKFDAFFKKKDSNNLLTNLTILLIIGIIIVIFASTFNDDEENGSARDNNIQQFPNSNEESNELIDNYAENIERKLEDILGLIKGIGDVKVMVTLEDTAERIPAINTTESKESTKEKDAQGGTREVLKGDSTKEVVTSGGNGQDTLIVIKEVKPNVKGVIVVAQGAENPQLKEKVYRAVKTVLGISGNRVEVFTSN